MQIPKNAELVHYIPAFVVSLFPAVIVLTAEVPSSSHNNSSESRKKTNDEPVDVVDDADQQAEHDISGDGVSHDNPSTLLPMLLSHLLLVISKLLDIKKLSISTTRLRLVEFCFLMYFLPFS